MYDSAAAETPATSWISFEARLPCASKSSSNAVLIGR